MCLYFDDSSKCSHPECIYIDNAKNNFSQDFKKNADKLAEIQFKHNEPDFQRDNRLKMNENDKYQTPFKTNQIKKDKRHCGSLDKKEATNQKYQLAQIDQFIDSQLKLMLDQNVTNFITQLSLKFTQNLKYQNNINELRLNNLQKRLQELEIKKGY